MRLYNERHQFYCGIDLHGKTMYGCVLDQDGKVRAHRNLRSGPEPFLEFIKPFRPDVVVGVECMFAWYWLADLCADEGINFVLGHALYMKMIVKWRVNGSGRRRPNGSRFSRVRAAEKPSAGSRKESVDEAAWVEAGGGRGLLREKKSKKSC